MTRNEHEPNLRAAVERGQGVDHVAQSGERAVDVARLAQLQYESVSAGQSVLHSPYG